MVDKIISRVMDSILRSFLTQSKLPQSILDIYGYSGWKTRCLYNNICSSGGTYLEVGTWLGSSFISAMYKNQETFGIVVDNWSMFNEDGQAKNHFYNNIEQHLDHKNIKIIDKDCWAITNEDIDNKTIDIFIRWSSYI